MNYYKNTCKELILLCKTMGIRGYSGKNKDALVALLQQKDSSMKQQIPQSSSSSSVISSKSNPNLHSAMCHPPGEVSRSIKSQRKTRNLGYNTTKSQDESYNEIEKKTPMARCSDGNHVGERYLSVRQFYLNKGGKSVQGACIICQKNRRANRIQRSRDRFLGKTKEEIDIMYRATYGQVKTCSKCKEDKPPSEFPVSVSMETGLHNHCILCSIGNSQGNGGLRDYIYLPDKDGIRYKKADKCQRCGGTDRLAVDHILPIAKGGTDCIANKQTLCIHCNSKKNDTIDCEVTSDMLCERYRDDSLNFSDTTSLSRILSKKVYEFRQSHIESKSLEEIRITLRNYTKTHNLGHNIDRIITKIASMFHKT